MAAPPGKTLRDLNGSWIMNKAESGDTDAILSLQGVGWLIRKTIGLATITLNFKQYKDEHNLDHIDIDQLITPGLQGTREQRTLNWEWREHKDFVFGSVKGRTRWIELTALPDGEDGNFMKEGWDEGTVQANELVETYVESQDSGWTARQTWGFELVNGVRKHSRHVIVKDKLEEKILRIKLYYDYNGPVPWQ